MRPTPLPLAAAALLACEVLACEILACAPARAEIRNAPSPRALEFAAYIFAASNVCGYRIGTDQFEALLAKQNTRIEDVQPRGPFGNRVQTMFTLMSNQMALNREGACLAVAGEYGPEGSVARNVLLPAGAADPKAVAPAPADPAAKPPTPPAPPAEPGKPAQ